MYGGQSPQYYQNNPFNQSPPPPPPPPQYYPQNQQNQGPTVITINNNNSSNGTYCPTCNSDTPTYTKRVTGAGNFIWCCICFAFFGPFALLALCMDEFGDTELRCVRCEQAKQVVQGFDC